jgi:hypothetical protein
MPNVSQREDSIVGRPWYPQATQSYETWHPAHCLSPVYLHAKAHMMSVLLTLAGAVQHQEGHASSIHVFASRLVS